MNVNIKKVYNLFFIFVIFIAGIIAYSNSFDCSLHFDDAKFFEKIEKIVSPGIGDWLLLFPSRPLGNLTFALNYYLHGLDVRGYHLINLIIHLTNALLIWRLILLTFSSPVMKNAEISRHKNIIAFLTGLLFVTHPLATQSVTYIAQRFASLATLFYLLSLILFVLGKLRQDNKTIISFLFGGSLISGILGMLTKEIVFTLPFAVLLYDYCFLRTSPREPERKNNSFILSLIMPAIFILLFFLLSPASNPFNTVPPGQGYSYSISMKEYFLTQFRVILTYLRLFILPINQNLDYDYPLSTGFFQLKTFFSFLFLLVILAMGVLSFKRYRLISFGIFWFFLTMSVESSIIPISQNVIFEHRTYLPSFGFFLALTGAFFYFFRERYIKIAVIVLLIIASINTVLTYQRNKIWESEYTLWSDCIKKSPNKARPNNNFGLVLFGEGKIKEAIEHYNKAISLTPDYPLPYYNRGIAYAELGQLQLAINDFSNAIRLQPEYEEAYYNRGNIYAKFGQYQLAIEDFNKAIALNPNYTKAYNNRGITHGKLGQYLLAINDFTNAIRLDQNNIKLYNNRGFAYAKLGQYQRAIIDYDEAIRLKPDYALAYNNRGFAYAKLGQYRRAIEDYNRAKLWKPDDEEVRRALRLAPEKEKH